MKTEMKTKFVKNGVDINIVKLASDCITDNLEPKIYTLNFHPMQGYWLTINKDRFNVPKHIFGNVQTRVDKIAYTYATRNTSTGVLLTGDKGAGKTLLTELISNTMIDKGLPVILINNAYSGSDFDNVISAIGECVLLFDEFGKTYGGGGSANNDDEGMAVAGGKSNTNQNGLLTLLDGTQSAKRLVLLTENEKSDINNFMLNRPGRMFYHFEYNKLAEDVITEYCKHHKVKKAPRKDLLEIVRKTGEFNFDMLKAIVEEQARFKNGIYDIIEDMNIQYNKEPERLEVLKIINKKTGKEYEPEIASAYVNRPERNGDYWTRAYYIAEHKPLPKTMPKKVRKAQEEMRANTPNKRAVEFCIDDVTYEKGEKLIYERNGMLIVCRPSIAVKYNYAGAF